MKKAKKTEPSLNKTNDGIAPIEDPSGAIDQYMPLPDEIYKKWEKQK